MSAIFASRPTAAELREALAIHEQRYQEKSELYGALGNPLAGAAFHEFLDAWGLRLAWRVLASRLEAEAKLALRFEAEDKISRPNRTLRRTRRRAG